MLCTFLGRSNDAYDKVLKKKRDENLFDLALFKKRKKQSKTMHAYMLNLKKRYVDEKYAVVNPSTGIALLKKGVKYARLSKRYRQKDRDLYDTSRVLCSISTAKKMIRHLFANSTVRKLIVYVANECHSTALFVERMNGAYKFTSYNPNHNQVMKMTQNVRNVINLKQSSTRTVRCVTSKTNNYKGECFSMTWGVIHEDFVINFILIL